jgi:ubiquitin carboxyl-terminal hydrolase 25
LILPDSIPRAFDCDAPGLSWLTVHRAYRGLGVIPNAVDGLVRFAYRRQTTCDPDNSPLYLQNLYDISTQRNSESLQFDVGLAVSEGAIKESDLMVAYNALGLRSGSRSDVVLATFRNKLATSPDNAKQLIWHMKTIGKATNNSDIIRAAENVITTVERAYSFLQVTAETDDSFVWTMYQLKVFKIYFAGTVN